MKYIAMVELCRVNYSQINTWQIAAERSRVKQSPGRVM